VAKTNFTVMSVLVKYCKSRKNICEEKYPVLTIEPNWSTFYVGEFVTFICDMNEGHDFDWSYLLLNMCESRSLSLYIDSQEQTQRMLSITYSGVYQCISHRWCSYERKCSNTVTVTVSVSNKVVVTRRPNWPQMFSGETITLTCEVQGGETTEWTYEWKRDGLVVDWINGKDSTFIVSESSSGDYMCQCRRRDDWLSSTMWSEAFRLSVSHKPRAKLTKGPTTIPVGGSVTLSCSTSSSSSAWKYVWYRGENCSELLTGEEAVFPSNGEINVSEEGLHWCRGKRGQPVYYTILSDPISIG
uniref:Ig-like domain-containing protein n=1 Tax=Poecilia formosa TaxID=48698 RepID=A0A096M3C3_POEFO